MGCAQSLPASPTNDSVPSTYVAINDKPSTSSSIHVFHEMLGEGVYATVWSASCKSSGKNCAVKIMDTRKRNNAPSTASEGDRKLLKFKALNEVRIWSLLGKHKHCIELVSYYIESGKYFMAMEQCDHGTLLDHFKRIRDMPMSELSVLLRGMLLGIEHCSNSCIVHRDIKPENFLFGGHQVDTVKLCDFGLATTAPRPHEPGLVGAYGTAPYMSPQLVADKPYNTKTDVWSLGVTMYETFLGSYPYRGERGRQHIKTMKQQIASGYPAPSYTPVKKLNAPSQDVISLVKLMLVRNEASRCSATQALTHSFLQQPHDDDFFKLVDREHSTGSSTWVGDSLASTCSAGDSDECRTPSN